MGRTLDSLRHGEPQRPLRVMPPTPEVPEDCVTDWTLQEEVPFIEVGGPNKKVELSPSLVKHPGQAKIQAPHQPMGAPARAPIADAPGSPAATHTSAPAVVNLTEARPMTVAFEPWPGPMAPAGFAPEIVAFHQPEHPVSREYAGLLEKMLQALQVSTPQALMLCGSKPRVGTTTVLLNLAVVAAGMRRRVAVVDMNTVRPGLAIRLGHAGPGGLIDVLAGCVALEQAMVPTALASLHLMPLGGAGKKHAPLTTEAIAWLMTCLRQRFDAILIDGPTIADTADLAILAPCVDGIYLVQPQGEPESTARSAAPMIARMGGRLRGMIHTHF